MRVLCDLNHVILHFSTGYLYEKDGIPQTQYYVEWTNNSSAVPRADKGSSAVARA